MQSLITVVYGQLLERVVFDILETVKVQDAQVSAAQTIL